MSAVTLQCIECASMMLISHEVQDRIAGRTGKISCKGCGATIGLDRRTPSFQLEGAAFVGELGLRGAPDSLPLASLLPAGSREPLWDPAELAEEHRTEARPAGARSGELAYLEDGEVLSVREAPAPSSPQVDPVLGGVAVRGTHADPSERPTPLPPHIAPRPSIAPPRPWELEARRSLIPVVHAEAPDLLDLSPVVPLQGVQLTTDGRLVNRSDVPPAALPGSTRSRTAFATLLAVASVAGVVVAGYAGGLPLGGTTQVGLVPSVSSAARAVLGGRDPEAPPETPAYESEPELVLLTAGERSLLGLGAGSIGVDAGTTSAPSQATGPAVGRSLPARESAARLDAATRPAAPSAEHSGAGTESLEPAEDGGSSVGVFDREAASLSLVAATEAALSCRSAEDPFGSARVLVTFAPSGRVTSATVNGPPFAGTETGGCIAGRFRAARVPAFAGEHVTVSKTVVIQ